MENLLEIRNLSKNFSSTNALNNVSFSIANRQVVGLLGPNGSGKTTLIKIIAGLINNFEGEVAFLGEKITAEAKKHIAYLPDVNFIAPNWDAHRCVGYFADFFDDFDKNKATSLLKDLKIPFNAAFKTLSKGTKEKLQLVLILSRAAKIYIFDEPIASVDPIARDAILRLIMDNYNRDSSLIISTHLVFSIEAILTHAIFLKYGEIIAESEVSSLKDSHGGKNLEDIFKEIF